MINRKLAVGSLLCLVLAVGMIGAGCGKKGAEVESPVATEVVESEASASDAEVGGVLETDASGDGDVVVTPDGIEVEVEEAKKIDDIISELKKDVAFEDGSDGKQVIDPEEDGVIIDTPKELTPAEENAKDWEDSVRESLGIDTSETEGAEGEETEADVVPETEEEYDSDGDPNTREIEGYDLAETEPERIDESGKIEQTPTQKIANVVEDNKGMTLGTNASESMKVGKVYHYFQDNGSKGSVGDFVMCGDLAVNIAPILANIGYTVSSSGDTAVITAEGYGDVTITKLNTDSLDVHKMTNAQIERMSGIKPYFMYTSSAVGSNGAYSACMTDGQYTNAVEYYKCTFGTYEIKYRSYNKGLIANMLATVSPESALNEVVK